MTVLIEEIVKCTKCGKEVPPKRVEILPSTKTCVNCSTTGAYVGRPVQVGHGDHTCTELEIMTPEQAQALKDKEEQSEN